jgi:hypothetical protein
MADEKKKKKLKVEDLEGKKVAEKEAKKVKGGVVFKCGWGAPQKYKN